jgi:hypothetical protein
VIVVQSTQDWQGEDLASLVIQRNWLPRPIWDLLPDALMRPGLVEVLDIGTQDTMQLLLLQNEQVIETLVTHAAHKPFTDGIGPWCQRQRNWLILVFGEPLKTTELSAMLLPYNVAGGGKECRPHHFFPYLKD